MPDTMPHPSMLDGVLWLAGHGFRCFPVFSLKPGAACQCGDPGCASPGKHPRISGWVTDASTDPAQLRAWWTKWPTANVGVALSAGQCGLDVDPRKGGDDTLAELEKDFGPTPRTWEVSTGGGGRHLYFLGDLTNTSGELGPGLDTRGLGGFLVAPPSAHVSGRAYAWSTDGHPDECSMQPVPSWIVGMLTKEESEVDPAGTAPEGIGPRALEWALRAVRGREKPRNVTGFNLACQLRDNRISVQDARPLLVRFAQEVTGEGDHPYTPAEAEHALQQAYTRAPRAPWSGPGPVPTIGGRPPLRAVSSSPRAFTDLGNAERFVDDHGEVVRYVHLWGRWLMWNGQRWAADESGEVIRLAKETVRKIWDEIPRLGDSEEKKTAAKHALKSESSGRIDGALQLARSELPLPVAPEGLDADPWLLNVENGLLDLRTGVLAPHDPAKLCTKVVPVAYNPAATCPQWLAFLTRCLSGDQALVDFLRRAVGYSLTGSTREQCLFVLYGTGANGKSTFLETVRALMADYAEQAEPKTFTERKTEQISNDIARLKGARLVAAAETESGARLAESLVKQMTGGDAIVARFLRQEFFTFKPEFKLWFATNHKPSIRGTDNGIWRRIRLVPWEVTIPVDERDQGLPEKLRGELPGILAWGVSGCREWLAGGLQEPARVLAATEEYREEMDRLAGFLEEKGEVHATGHVPVKVFYEEYAKWAEAGHEQPISKKAFVMSLQERGFRTVKKGDKNVRTIIGIRLRADTSGFTCSPPMEANSINKQVEPLVPAREVVLLCAHSAFRVREGRKFCAECGEELRHA